MVTGGNTVITNHKDMNTRAPQGKLPLDYFLLVFGLAIPFWLFGGSRLPLPINLPAGALVTIVPATAAAILSYRQSGLNGIKELFKKALDYKKIKRKVWYLPALLLAPLIYFLSYQKSAEKPLPSGTGI
jgi:hypothetical protein